MQHHATGPVYVQPSFDPPSHPVLGDLPELGTTQRVPGYPHGEEVLDILTETRAGHSQSPLRHYYVTTATTGENGPHLIGLSELAVFRLSPTPPPPPPQSGVLLMLCSSTSSFGYEWTFCLDGTLRVAK